MSGKCTKRLHPINAIQNPLKYGMRLGLGLGLGVGFVCLAISHSVGVLFPEYSTGTMGSELLSTHLLTVVFQAITVPVLKESVSVESLSLCRVKQ